MASPCSAYCDAIAVDKICNTTRPGLRARDLPQQCA